MIFNEDSLDGLSIFGLCVLTLILILSAAGCAGKETVKPSEDSLLTSEAIHNIQQIKEAYEQKNTRAIHTLSDPDIARELANEMSFNKVQLTFSSPRFVRISDSDVNVIQNWQGQWVVDGKTLRNTGVSKLIFQKDSLKLIRIDGDNPFLIPENRN